MYRKREPFCHTLGEKKTENREKKMKKKNRRSGGCIIGKKNIKKILLSPRVNTKIEVSTLSFRKKTSRGKGGYGGSIVIKDSRTGNRKNWGNSTDEGAGLKGVTSLTGMVPVSQQGISKETPTGK